MPLPSLAPRWSRPGQQRIHISLGLDGGQVRGQNSSVIVVWLRVENIREPARSSLDNTVPLAILLTHFKKKCVQGLMELIGEELLRLGPLGVGLFAKRRFSKPVAAPGIDFVWHTVYLSSLPADAPARAQVANVDVRGHQAQLFCTWCFLT